MDDSSSAEWVNLRSIDLKSIIDDRLHKATSTEEVIKLLKCNPPADINAQLENGDTPLHTYVRKGDKGYPLLLTLMSHSDPDRLELDANGEKLNTPLHFASELNNLKAAKALIAFGADLCVINYYQQSPLDLARNNDYDDMMDLLFTSGCDLGSNICNCMDNFVALPHAPLNRGEKDNEEIDWKDLSLESSNSSKSSLSKQAEESYSAWLEWKKQTKAKKEAETKQKHSNFPVFDRKKGERVLFLDGGGVRGLIQTEVLSHITRLTGRTIPELFDWVVGTSTGGIVALSLVYSQLMKETFDVPQLRKLYFEIKDRVFGRTRLGLGCDTDALEKILKREFGNTRMVEVPQGTKVLISAVDKRTDKLEVRWFNNCLNNKYSGELIWKVARYTSAAPCYFKPLDNYIDGGLRVNNPSEDAMTLIQDHLRATKPGRDVMLVVSIGCGEFPGQTLGDVDLEKYLFFGKHWLTPWKIVEEFNNLIRMLAEGITNSESAASNTRSRCQGQGIPYYRFSPQLDEVIQLSETDNEVLIGMILKARADITSKQMEFEMLIQSFYQ